MSILSPIDKDLAVVYSPLMSVSFRKLLIAKGFDLIDISEEEYDSLASNVLAVAPRVCVMAEGSPKTKKRLEDHGVEVEIFSGAEICLKGTGGPTCLTRPLEREI
jgi:N-dimethylarginine dimethylaminohydrolase